MAWLWSIHHLYLLAVMVTCSWARQGCIPNGLLNRHSPSPPFTLDNVIIIKLRPHHAVKKLILHILLEDDNGTTIYALEINEDMDHVSGNMEVTLVDAKTGSNIVKVPWPPIIVSRVWTTMYLSLHYHHLLQLAVIPQPPMDGARTFVHSQILLKPAAITATLERFGVTKLKLTLPTNNISIDYTINCDEDSLAETFASEFRLTSNIPFWRSLTWILLGLLGILVVLLGVTCTKIHLGNTKDLVNSMLTRFKSGKKSSITRPVAQTTLERKLKDPGKDKKEDILGVPRITTGVVSSRAPSPGHELDENTMDYVNKAFSCDED